MRRDLSTRDGQKKMGGKNGGWQQQFGICPRTVVRTQEGTYRPRKRSEALEWKSRAIETA